ncbi:hypothetical protein C8Q80DRAFT_1125405 [Daedaleopsis nitida]|nr:hypothetical protein C8Q80DRAFT_1125405 [Daedaleopsis nitida]
MSYGLVSSLPVELLVVIGSFVRRRDLRAFLLANRLLNSIGTPLLYSRIELHDVRTAYTCFRTLRMLPKNASFRRHLAKFVRFLEMSSDCFYQSGLDREHSTMFGGRLPAIVLQLVNLQELRCGDGSDPQINGVLEIIATMPYPRLETLQLILDTSGDSVTNITTPMPCLPKLRNLHVEVPPDLHPKQVSLLRYVLATAAGQLQSLTLSTSESESTSSDNPPIIPPDIQFPSLRHLGVDSQALLHIEAQAENIRSLSLLTTSESFEMSPTSFPAVEELGCVFYHVSTFLSPATEGFRSIHTITLDLASYKRNGGDFTDYVPRWRDLEEAFGCFKYSAVSIRHLRFFVSRLNIILLGDALEGLKELESLLMVINTEPHAVALLELGIHVLPKLPRLHTLLISDAVLKFDKRDARFWFARDLEMQRMRVEEYEEHAPALRLVAFTTEFEWEKGADGKWFTTEEVENEVRDDPQEFDWSTDEEPTDEESDSDESDGDEGGDEDDPMEE